MMATNAISFTLLNKYRDGVEEKLMVQELGVLKDEMLIRGHDVAYGSNFTHAVAHGVSNNLF